MPLVGTLSTLPLPELLKWLGTTGRSGTLQIERNKVVKWIVFEQGRVTGCSSDDPPERLGQFLLSQGRISEQQLREALRLQETSDKHLGAILVESGALSPEELRQDLAAKAEETLYSIFDWQEAVFRFQDGPGEARYVMPLEMSVEDLLRHGLERHDELRSIREVFDEPTQVLRRTPRKPPEAVFRNRMARQIYESIDGQRTVEEILLLARSSEYLVKKFLYELRRNGFAEISGKRELKPPTLPPAETATPQPTVQRDKPAPSAAPSTDLQDGLAAARESMQKGDYDVALQTLDAVYKQHPQDESLRRLMAEAEAAFIEKAYRHYLPAGKIPVLTRPPESLESESFTPEEFFLISRIDGTWDVKSIIQITPLREPKALRTLKALRERGIIDLRDPD